MELVGFSSFDWLHALWLVARQLTSIGSNIEMNEQCTHEGCIQQIQPHITPGQINTFEVNENVPNHDRGQLDDLDLCDVPLPPKVLLHVRAQCGQTVVAVHDHVDNAIDHGNDQYGGSVCREAERG